MLGILPQPSAEPGAAGDPALSRTAPYRIYNIGNGRAVDLMRFIEILGGIVGAIVGLVFAGVECLLG